MCLRNHSKQIFDLFKNKTKQIGTGRSHLRMNVFSVSFCSIPSKSSSFFPLLVISILFILLSHTKWVYQAFSCLYSFLTYFYNLLHFMLYLLFYLSLNLYFRCPYFLLPSSSFLVSFADISVKKFSPLTPQEVCVCVCVCVCEAPL